MKSDPGPVDRRTGNHFCITCHTGIALTPAPPSPVLTVPADAQSRILSKTDKVSTSSDHFPPILEAGTSRYVFAYDNHAVGLSRPARRESCRVTAGRGTAGGPRAVRAAGIQPQALAAEPCRPWCSARCHAKIRTCGVDSAIRSRRPRPPAVCLTRIRAARRAMVPHPQQPRIDCLMGTSSCVLGAVLATRGLRLCQSDRHHDGPRACLSAEPCTTTSGRFHLVTCSHPPGSGKLSAVRAWQTSLD